ncbi:MAG: right-handed parallel beta-helix repeat-containing protein [Treponema sp.]|nr:right-handed parallel beta-helix repeat-containing protein [Treponema sp.]
MINKTFRAFLIAAAFAGLVSSCSNLESGPMSQPVFLGGQGQVKMAVLSGSIGFGGAMPRGLSQSLAASDLSFTAFPGIPSGDSIVYTIWAELSSDSSVKYPAVVADDKKSYTVSIPIGDEEKTYVIKGEVKSGETLLCSGTTETFPISQSAPVAAKNLVLGGAASFSGKGEIALEILIDSATEIDSCAATCEGANIGEASYAVSDGKVTVAVAEIDSGSRLVDFAFYKGASLLYQFSELVNVFDAMKTDTWVQNGVGGDPWLETTTDAGTGAKTTVCKVTQALVQSFALTEFYVDSTRQNTNPAGSDYTKGSGTAQNPCVSLSDAIAYMRDTATDYTIYIIGTLEGAQLIPTYLKKEKNEGDDPSYKYAKSLTICGASGYSGGEPVSAIDAKSTDTGDKQTALTLHSLVPVTIKDLKITGGWYDGNSIGGGGIYMKENTTLTLSSGALVMGNRSKGSGGGGIYIDEGAALTIEDGAVIKDNHEVSASSNTGGGAIFNYSGTVTMKGGIIANNTAVHDGGAIYCDNGSFTMEGGVIGDDNTSETATLEDDKHSNYAAGKGGAIFL